ncbi:MAG: ubiquinol-cytochrome c reductase iron-sulfur subunit [Rubripirellula sp.]
MCEQQEYDEANDPSRRSFLTRLSVSLSALIGAAIALPGIGYVLAPVVGRPPQKWRGIGSLEQFKVGETKLVQFRDAVSTSWSGDTARTGAWVRRTSDEEFIAFSVNCRHLGCPVRWVKEASLFMCPCHGGVYYEDGEVAAGPPPEALARYAVWVVDGEVEIETAPIPLTTNDVV